MSYFLALALLLSMTKVKRCDDDLTFLNFDFKLLDLKVKRGLLIQGPLFVRLEYLDDSGVLL